MQIDHVSDVGVEIRSLKSKLKDARARARHFKEMAKEWFRLFDIHRLEVASLRHELVAANDSIRRLQEENSILRQHPLATYRQSQFTAPMPPQLNDQLAAQLLDGQMAAQRLYSQAQNAYPYQQGLGERQCTCVPGRSSLLNPGW